VNWRSTGGDYSVSVRETIALASGACDRLRADAENPHTTRTREGALCGLSRSLLGFESRWGRQLSCGRAVKHFHARWPWGQMCAE
jgi:hypothetical protein